MIGKLGPLQTGLITQQAANTVSAFRAIRNPTHRPAEIMRMFKRPFYNRVGLGIESSVTVDFFLKHRLSTAMGGTLRKIAGDRAKYAKELDVFKKDFEKARGHAIPEEHLARLEECGRPWQIFNQAPQSILREESKRPYVDYYRAAMNAAFARDGEVLFHLGGKFEVQNYVEDILLTEKREDMPFQDFINKATYVDLAGPEVLPGAHRRIVNENPGKPARTGITNVEIYDLTVGSYQHLRERVQYFSNDGAKLDTREFLNRHADLLATTMTQENRERVYAGQEMTPEARLSIAAFQRYLKGR